MALLRKYDYEIQQLESLIQEIRDISDDSLEDVINHVREIVDLCVDLSVMEEL